MEEAKSPQTGPFIFYCPHTGLKVQGLAAANDTENDKIYAATPCPACGDVHMVNLKSGKILGSD